MGIKRQSPGKWQVHDISGVGAGWKLYTYIPGTTDNKDTYSDSAGLVANTNPIIFDTRGEAEIWWDGIYDAVLTDENDVLIDNYPNIGAGEGTINYGNYNLLTDGGFEDDSNGDGLPDQWDVTAYPTAGSGAGVVVIDTSTQLEGLNSLKFTSVGDGGGFAVSNFFNVREGGQIAAQWSMKSTDAGVRNVVEIIWYTSAQVQISTSSLYDDSTTNPTSWTQKNGSVTAVTNARYAKLRVYGCHSSDATSGSTWYDAISVVSDTIFGDLSIVNNLTVGGDLIVTGASSAASYSGPLTGNVTGNATGSSGSCTGNAATATALETARTIGGVSFDGTANINLPGVNTTGNQNTSGNAATADTANAVAGSSVGETGIDWANAGAIAPGLVTSLVVNATSLTYVDVDTFKIKVPNNAIWLDYIIEIYINAGTSAEARLNSPTGTGAGVTTTSSSYVYSSVQSVDVSSDSGWETFTLQAKVTGSGTAYIRRVYAGFA